MRRILAVLALLCGLADGAHAQGTLRVYGDYPNVTVTGTLSETILASIPIPAGAMPANGMARLTWTAANNNSANNKVLTVRLGASSGVSGTSLAIQTQTTNIAFQTVTMIRNANATGSQAILSATNLAPYGTSTNTITAAAIDTTAQSFINITGTLANVADSLTLNGWTLEIIKP